MLPELEEQWNTSDFAAEEIISTADNAVANIVHVATIGEIVYGATTNEAATYKAINNAAEVVVRLLNPIIRC